MKVSASIVLYNSNSNLIADIISKLVNYLPTAHLFLIDNSKNDCLKILKNSNRITYIHNVCNTGFGNAHNIALKCSIELGFKYHFIINPDVIIKKDIFNPMINYIHNNYNVGIMMPRILNLDGTLQNLPKLLPKPYDLIKRKLHTFFKTNSVFLKNYELRYNCKEKISNVPIISGCFMLLNLKAIKDLGMFDSDFFMYFEDWDLSRRIHKSYKTIYFPYVEIYHHYESGANKNFRLFFIYLKSAIKYFNKWGWFIDFERTEINKKTLDQFINE
jgi:GT2 family glycosyltransferase